MGKYGEPWQGERDQFIDDAEGEMIAAFMDMGDTCANRAVLCVNACEGMSDEEVKELRGLKDQFTIELQDNNDVLQEASDAIDSLKAQLAEAEGLLKIVLPMADPFKGSFGGDAAKTCSDIRNFLNRKEAE